MLSRTLRPAFTASAQRFRHLTAAVAGLADHSRVVTKKAPFFSRSRRVPISVKETQEISVLEQFHKLSKDLEFMPIPNCHPLHEIATKVRGRKYLTGSDGTNLGIQVIHDEKIIEEVK